MPSIELRCRGTQRGSCGFPLTDTLDKMRKRCPEHFEEWVSSMDMDKCIVIYHGKCNDGFGAAWIAQKKWPKAKFIPVQYGTTPPVTPRNTSIIMLDFAYPYEQVKRWMEKGRYESFLILDHHKTAMDELSQFTNHTYFDMHKSGAMITWDFFFAPVPAPRLIEYIQDRDLWLHRLAYSAEVSAAITSYPRTFDSWNILENKSVNDLIGEGRSILRYIKQQVDELCNKVIITNIGSYIVPVVNASNFMSELGGELNKKYPKSPFSASYFDREDGKRQWSLRSIGDFDVSVVAKQFGGGGHKNAAGFTTSSTLPLILTKEDAEKFYEATSKTSGRS